MRITYLHQYFNTPVDAGSTRSYELARRLVMAGHEVQMITSDQSARQAGGSWRTSTEAGIQVHWLPVPYANELSYKERIQAFWRFAWKAATKAAALPSDIVFATSTPLTIALPAVYSAKRRGVPMVFEVRDLWPEIPIAVGALRGPLVPPARWLEKFAYANATRIVALSPGMRAGIVGRGIEPDRVHVIPNGADIETFQVPAAAGLEFRRRYEWLQDRPLVLYAGTLGLINGVNYFAQVARHLLDLAPDICCLVIGGGREQESVERTAAELNVLNRNFYMLNRIPKMEMPAALSAAQLASSFVIDVPALWDNSANKFFDALAAGRAMAINHGGWQADLLREHGAGLVLPPHDFRGAAEMIVSFLSDPARVDAAGQAAFALATTQFARDLLAEQLEQVLIDATS